MRFHQSGHLQDLYDRRRCHSDALVRRHHSADDAWDLVHFLRTLQVHRHGKENDVLKALGGKIPPYVEKHWEAPATQPSSGAAGGGK
jgi:hypothetical protein